MASRARRRSITLIATTALTVGAAALAGCSADLDAATSKQVAAVPGAGATLGPSGTIAIRDVTIVYNGTAGYPVGANAPLTVRIFNAGSSAIQLTKVSAPDYAPRVVLVGAAGTVTTSATETATPTPSGESSFSVAVSGPGYTLLVPGQGQYLQLVGLTKELKPGQTVPVTFTFADNSSITLAVPIAPPATPAARVTPTASERGAE